jgi:UPF0716 protein FxsA
LFGRLLLLMTVVPAVELYLLIKIGGLVGPLTTIWLVILTGVVGASLARREGLSVLRQVQEDSRKGVAPTQSLTEALMVLIGGILLITPGVVTDLVGLLSIFPWTRRLVAPMLGRSIKSRIQVMDGVEIGTPAPGPAATHIRDQFDHPVQ